MFRKGGGGGGGGGGALLEYSYPHIRTSIFTHQEIRVTVTFILSKPYQYQCADLMAS